MAGKRSSLSSETRRGGAAGAAAVLLGFALLLLALTPVRAAEDLVPIHLETLINLDDSGRLVGFPQGVFYDRFRGETYLVSSTGRITVYDKKFFPVTSFGRGRGLFNPQGVDFDAQGNIYVAHGSANAAVPPRLTIYNQAFFPVREWVFGEVEGLENFSCRRLAVSSTGEIYMIGHGEKNRPGALVMSPAGEFLRRIVPLSDDSSRAAGTEEELPPEAAGAGEAALKQEEPADSAPEVDRDIPDNLPEGLRPARSARDQEEEEEKPAALPVSLSDIKIDRNGRLYLLSRVASRIYVYNARDELLFTFGEKGGAARKLSNPISLAVDVDRRVIYVCDYMRHTILVYDYDTGRYIFEFGGRGLSPLWFNFPNDVAVDSNGLLVVSDLFNRRVQVMNANMLKRRPLQELAPALPAAAAPAVSAPAAAPAVSAPAPVEKPRARRSPPALPAAPAAGFSRPGRASAPALPAVLAGTAARIHEVSDALRLPPLINRSRARPARRLRLPAALGVYGPVAALGLLGSWLLYRNR